MFLVVLRRSGPEYDHSKPLEQQSGWEEHAAFRGGLVEGGFLVRGAGLADELRTAPAVEAGSEEEIRERLAQDPWSGSHLVVDSIDGWTIPVQRSPHALQ